MDEAARTDRIAFLLDGRLLAEDTPAGLLAQTGAVDLEDAVLRLSERAPLVAERRVV
jgi:ABC-2 type transport system ATP-binding protein